MSDSQVSTIDDAVESPKKRTKSEQIAASKSGRYMVTIFSSGDPGGADAVFVSPGPEAVYIPRDTPCEVSAAVVEGLKNAVMTSYEPDQSGKPIERSRQRFAFSAVPA